MTISLLCRLKIRVCAVPRLDGSRWSSSFDVLLLAAKEGQKVVLG